MDYRDIPYALKNNYGYYTPVLYDIYSKMDNSFVGKDANEKIHVWINEKSINYQMMQGKGLVDIGTPDPLLGNVLPASRYYSLETREVWGYPEYSADFQSSSDLRPNSGG